MAYQTRMGGIVLDWGKDIIPLKKERADIIAYDIPDFDMDRYNKFYSPIKI